MTKTRRFKNVVIFLQTTFSFVIYQESYLLDLPLVSDGTTIESLAEAKEILSTGEPAMNADQEILKYHTPLICRLINITKKR